MTTAEYYELNKDRIYLFNQGSYQNAYELMGAHPCTEDGQEGTRFTVWVPGAEKVSVMGDFNGWSEEDDQLQTMWDSGIWTLFVPGAAEGQAYKYRIETGNGQILYKADPYGYWSEKRPKSASVIRRLDYEWHDGEWMDRRARSDHFRQPKNIYEVHLGSWKRHSGRPKEEQFYTYSEIAADLVPYAKKMGYTHLEIMPVMEHPLDDSWGYQLTGYYAATSRFGTPQQLMELIDTAHQAGIGIILDWVPAHFCRDDHGLVRFNGEMLYEKTEHPQWGTLVFDYGRLEVKSFLLSNAVFWIEKYHADGLRVDGVSSMLYLNFGIDDPEKKRFNKYGEEGNLEAIDFLQDLARTVGARFPGVFTVAEESTAWPKVTHPADQGGLGFHYKWDMGWMHDTLEYISTDYLFRKYHQNQISFSMMYAHSENFILPLSHDEVVHGKKSIIGRQQGDYQRQFAGLKALAVYQMTHPGGKLNFMGTEIAQFIEWRFYEELEWFLLQYPSHKAHQEFVRKLNHVYKDNLALWELDYQDRGFEWIDADDSEHSVYSYARFSGNRAYPVICIINFGWNGCGNYRIGVPRPGKYKVLINSGDESAEGRIIKSQNVPMHGRPWSIELDLPQTCGIILKKIRSNN
ncbi:MAG: 1,4-alpha-glucan branching protein GlgB [Firmicutes bacterium]|nr:1,4-alpha-glucan branching protein GlgB [Bacillota bacterium]MBQ3931010.1 1,4-alpha-glucan branching protein GlgB [Bacillota bacterium]